VSNKDFVDHLESVIRQRAATLEQERAAADADVIARN
jgi:(E)-4-hydroxy-3-methylbut-2-enyl-diphosphate synthase